MHGCSLNHNKCMCTWHQVSKKLAVVSSKFFRLSHTVEQYVVHHKRRCVVALVAGLPYVTGHLTLSSLAASSAKEIKSCPLPAASILLLTLAFSNLTRHPLSKAIYTNWKFYSEGGMTVFDARQMLLGRLSDEVRLKRVNHTEWPTAFTRLAWSRGRNLCKHKKM